MPSRPPIPEKEAEDKFKEAAEAYAVLADGDKRHMYDRFGHAGLGSAATGGFDPTVFNGFEDILGGLGDVFGFGDIFGAARRRGPQRGADLRYDLEISFDEAAKGTETTVQIPRQETCGTCHGNGSAPGSGRRRARSVRGADRFDCSRDRSRLRAPAAPAAEPAPSSQSRARRAAAPGACKEGASSPSKFLPESPQVSVSV